MQLHTFDLLKIKQQREMLVKLLPHEKRIREMIEEEPSAWCLEDVLFQIEREFGSAVRLQVEVVILSNDWTHFDYFRNWDNFGYEMTSGQFAEAIEIIDQVFKF